MSINIRTSILLVSLTFSSCVVYVPTEYFDNYTQIKSKPDLATPKQNGYYYNYFDDNKYCTFFFFFRNNLTASISIPTSESNQTIINNPDTLLSMWINTEKFKDGLRWRYYDFKSDSLSVYNAIGPESQNSFLSIATLSKLPSICEKDSLHFIGKAKNKYTFLYLFKYTKVVKAYSSSFCFRTSPLMPDTTNNEFGIKYNDYLKNDSRIFYRWY